ncbi:MAG TPA: hypothetical protein VFI17_11145 [Solirubrobacterales bacterium]|nr:hypothetical protein [Solirubrobacterales bacterium]
MPRRSSERPRRSVTPAAVVFTLLVLATGIAFVYSQRVKREPLVLDKVSFVGAPHRKGEPTLHSFTPNGDCRHDRIRIRFRTTISGQGTVQVIKPGGRVVVTLARDSFLKRYSFHTYYWDGRQRGGGTARRGRYKLRVKLGDRVLVTPGVIALHPAPERRRSLCATTGGSGGVAPGSKP